MQNQKQSYYERNKEKLKEKARKHYAEHKEEAKKYYEDHKEYFQKAGAAFRAENPNYNSFYSKYKRKELNEKLKARIKTSPHLKNRMWLQTRLSYCIKQNKPFGEQENIFGCTVEEFRSHIEKQFTRGMNWENHAKFWELDHIVPCSAFNLAFEDEQKKCYHFSNIRPLEKTLNRKKGTKINTQLTAKIA